MTGTREGAIARARAEFDDGRFTERLARLVAVPTESHPPERKHELERYCHAVLGPMVQALGFETAVLDNPDPIHGPVLVATRIEDPALPTVLLYGHGDVVRAMPERWRADLDPWVLKVEGDRIYGRGTVDNKGQHLLGIDAMGAVMAERGGRLGFNAKVMVETGEEAGSPGLLPFIRLHRDRLAADVFIALDGPRVSRAVPDITLGTRGGVAMDLVVDLRPGGHHSGHWGGLLKDAGVVLAHAIASVISRDGRILVPGWRPRAVPESVGRAARAVRAETLPGAPVPEPGWGEPGLNNSERIYAWSSAILLASISGQPEAPVNAVGGTARARIQLRHTVDVPGDQVVPALRDHLAKEGFPEVQVVPVTERDMFQASRTDPADPWVKAVEASFAATAGQPPNIIPTLGASGPSEFFRQELGTPVIWIPHSYGGCGQHGPDEHGLGSLFRDGLGLMAGLWWDIGEGRAPR